MAAMKSGPRRVFRDSTIINTTNCRGIDTGCHYQLLENSEVLRSLPDASSETYPLDRQGGAGGSRSSEGSAGTNRTLTPWVTHAACPQDIHSVLHTSYFRTTTQR